MPMREMVKGKLYVEFPSMASPKKFSLYQHKLLEFEEEPAAETAPEIVVIAIGRDQVEKIDHLEANEQDTYLDTVSDAYWLSMECELSRGTHGI